VSDAAPRPRRSIAPKLIFAIAVLAAVILLGSRAPGGILGMTRDDLLWIAALVAILLFLGGGLLGRPMRPMQIIRGLLIWTVVILLTAGVYASRDELAGFAGRLVGALAPGVPIAGRLAGEADPDSVVITRAGDGHFAVRASVDDKPLLLMVDTGASFVTLTFSDAANLGFAPETLTYNLPIRTANGTITTAAIVIDSLGVGPIERSGVRALVAPRGALDQSLLGLSFLNTLNSYAIAGDRLVLTP
jgi:aspartyl protease family protein